MEVIDGRWRKEVVSVHVRWWTSGKACPLTVVVVYAGRVTPVRVCGCHRRGHVCGAYMRGCVRVWKKLWGWGW